MTNNKPPRFAAWIVRRISGPEERLSIAGDTEEMYQDMVRTHGLDAARSWYRAQALRSVPMFLVKFICGSCAMFKNYFKLGLRNILKHKRFALLNIMGLAVGLASCLLMAGYVMHEMSFEAMHPFRDRIYRVNGRIPMGDRILHNAVVAAPFGPAAEESIPEIEASVRILRRHHVPVGIEDKVFKEQKIFFAEQAFLEAFNVPLVRGIQSTALEAPFTLILDENLARKYFGDRDPLGHTVRLTLGPTREFQVTGVMRNMPSNTVLRTPIIASFATLYQTHREAMTHWESWGSFTTFFRLTTGADPSSVETKLTRLARSRLPEDAQDASYYLQPLGSIYIGRAGRNMNNDLDNSGSLTRIYIFSGIALLILVVAAINFINLSTAKISGRMKEVGIRKTCGAVRSHLINQFMMESLLLASAAMGTGLLLFSWFKPRLDQYLGKSLSLGVLSTPWILPIVIGMVLVVGLLAGSYPAWLLSRFPAAVVFRLGTPRGPSKFGLRRVLVGFQFFIAVVLIICTLAVLKQVGYSEAKDLGYDHDNLIVLSYQDAHRLRNAQAVKSQIQGRSGIVSMASVDRFPSAQNRNISTIRTAAERDQEGIIAQSMEADEGFVVTLGLHLVEGRNFEMGRVTDEQSVLINETAARAFELENPLGAILYRGDRSFQVIGILKDWHTNSIHAPIYPMVIFRSDETAAEFVIRLPSGGSQEVLAGVREAWSEILPGQIFDYSYVDDLHLRAYDGERRLASLLTSFCELTVFVACLGIFGLAASSSEQRTKEIGIRKVLGSGVVALLFLLSRSYVRWVLTANFLAWPISYFIVDRWLQDFAYRASMGLGPFLTAAVLALIVALVSVFYQTLKAALANPVRSLRYE
jgi:putative ABC transport system permease protein